MPFFIAKCIATATISLPQRNRNLFPRKNRCVQFDRVNESQTLTANHRREAVHLDTDWRATAVLTETGQSHHPTPALTPPPPTCPSLLGTGKGGHCERGLFTGGISRISKISRISRKWSDSSLFSRVWGFCKISRISNLNSLESLEIDFPEKTLFQKTPFSEPDFPFFFGGGGGKTQGKPRKRHKDFLKFKRASSGGWDGWW